MWISIVAAFTKSIISYLKGIIQELDQRSVSHAVYAVAAPPTYTDIVNITDKGVFTGISQVFDAIGNSDDYGYFKIIIDGVTIITDARMAVQTGTNDMAAGVAVAFNHRFNTSFQAQYKTMNAVAALQNVVTYTTDT